MADPVILLTGATGFIGGATLVKLLATQPHSRVLLLVRAESIDHATARLKQSLARFVDIAEFEERLNNCAVILGDLSDPDHSPNSPRSIAKGTVGHELTINVLDELTHVLHLAANTSFRSVRSVRQTKILGTLALAHRFRGAKRLRRFLYVSTASFVATRRNA